jgi:5,10-methylenetetrahydrofolate reductase
MGLKESLESGKFVVTSEIGPFKGTEVNGIMKDAELMNGSVDAVNVTDLQSSVMRLGSLATCHLLKDRGLEPVFQMTCRDRNRLALQSDLLSASVLGIENVLALTGDYTTLGDHPDARPVFDLDSIQLLWVIDKLQQGQDMVGNELRGTPKFFPGAAVKPIAEPIEPQIAKMEKKVEAGAKFFQTQAVYDLSAFERFMKKVEHLKVPVLAGIILLKSAGMARFMNKNVAGVLVPDNLIEKMSKAEDRVKTSIEIAADLIKGLKGLCQGVHIMPIGWEKRVPAVLDAAGL